VGFAVKHMLFSTVRGKFNDVRATAEIDEQTGSLSSVNAEISVASVDTDNAKRDGHLRSDDFFNAERYPTITFESTSIAPGANGNYRVDGILTIRDVSKPITLEGKLLGKMPGRVAFEAAGQINRQDFNVTWNKALQSAGGLMVSDEVDLNIEVALYVPEG
ncbi:MAG: YceI family protein, partial [SAR324 cluster bacterium]|nr:YceI family protein [SAR324 cluster bacterium]